MPREKSVFYAGRWRTIEGIERHRENGRRRARKLNPERVFLGAVYLGKLNLDKEALRGASD